MRNNKKLALFVAVVMVFSLAAVPPAHAFVGIAALSVIIASTFASAVFVDKAVVKQKSVPVTEHSASKKKTPHQLQASTKP
jgi:uncharacterized membrane protein